MKNCNTTPRGKTTRTKRVNWPTARNGEPMKLLKRIWRVLFANPKTCNHKWLRDGELYVKCDKCGELAVYVGGQRLSLIHISEPTRRSYISYAVFCLKKKFF